MGTEDVKVTAMNMYKYKESKGVARGGGSWGARDPPSVSRFLLKQPTIFRFRKREYPLFDTVTPPLKNPGYVHGKVTFIQTLAV